MPLRVLIADDNRDGAETLGALLGFSGYSVQIANDGEAAIALADAFNPRLLILDIGMPKLDGYAVAKRLRENPRFERATIVAFTGYGDLDARKRVIAAGFDWHFVKGSPNAEILAFVAKVAAGLESIE